MTDELNDAPYPEEVTYAGDKQFLTKADGENASIVWNVNRHKRSDSDAWIDAEIRISDCYKIAVIDMSVSLADKSISKEKLDAQHRAKLDKIESLLFQLEQFKIAYNKALKPE